MEMKQLELLVADVEKKLNAIVPEGKVARIIIEDLPKDVVSEPTEDDVIETYAAEDYIFNNSMERPVQYVHGGDYVVKTKTNNTYVLLSPLFTLRDGDYVLRSSKAFQVLGEEHFSFMTNIDCAINNIQDIVRLKSNMTWD